jgi:7-cyano-7-deazaguanine synthase
MLGIAVVSGGLDSVTMLYDLAHRGDEVGVVSFNYGQRHAKELTHAEAIVSRLGFKHRIIDIPSYGRAVASSNSTLVDHSAEVPEGSYDAENMKATVVPNRNMVMLSMASGVAVASKAQYVATAVHAGDHAIYPDCRPGFISYAESAIKSGNEGFIDPHFEIRTPFIYMTKTDIARRAFDLGVPIDQTWSCYKGGDYHCGRCGTCVERLEALHDANVIDKTVYMDTEFWKSAVVPNRT